MTIREENFKITGQIFDSYVKLGQCGRDCKTPEELSARRESWVKAIVTNGVAKAEAKHYGKTLNQYLKDWLRNVNDKLNKASA